MRRTYEGNKDKDDVNNEAVCGADEEMCNRRNENNDGCGSNGEKQLKGDDGVHLTYEGPSQLRILNHRRVKGSFSTLHVSLSRHFRYAIFPHRITDSTKINLNTFLVEIMSFILFLCVSRRVTTLLWFLF